MFSRRSGFTLAEVLITLTIIGIVAAITIPSIQQNTRDAEYTTLARKAYNVLISATTKIRAEKGGFTNFADAPSILSDYGSVMNFVKTGPMNTLFPCSSPYKDLDGGVGWNCSSDDRPSTVLADGMTIGFSTDTFPCSDGSGTCRLISLDTNGSKPSNQEGKDLLSFVLGENSGIVVGGGLCGANPKQICLSSSDPNDDNRRANCFCARVLGQLP